MMTEFLTLTLIGLLVIISPGPDFAVVTKTSLGEGRLAGSMAAVGISMANLCHVGINLLGIGVVIAKSAVAFTVLKILGAVYLLYIGYKGLRAQPLNTVSSKVVSDKSTSVILDNSPKRHVGKLGFLNGFFTSLLNPKVCLFFLSLFSVIISAETPILTQVFYGAWLSILAMAWFLLVAFFFTNALISSKLKQYKHWLERLTGGALVFLGLRLLSGEATF